MSTNRQPNRGEPQVSDSSRNARIAAVRARVAELRRRVGVRKRAAADAQEEAWPADLCSGTADEPAWGADPEEVTRG